MTKDSEYEELKHSLAARGLVDERWGRRYCLVKAPDGGLGERTYAILWDVRAEPEAVVADLRGRGDDRWRVFEADVIPVYEVLDPGRLALPARPKVVEINPELSTGAQGRPVLRVWVVLDDDTTEAEQGSWESLRPIADAVHDGLQSFFDAHGIDLWPSLYYRTRSQYEGRLQYAR